MSRILIHRVIARLNVGGPAMHVVYLTRGVDDGRPFRTRLVAGRITPDEGDMGYFAEERGVDVHYLEAMDRKPHAWDDLRSLWALYRLFRRERPTIVHTHTAKAGALGRLAAILAGVPVRIHTFHGHVLGGSYFSPLTTRIFLGVEQALARWTHRIVALTEGRARELCEGLGVAERDRFRVIPLGLELGRFAGSLERRGEIRGVARRDLGIDPEEPVVGIVGRMVPIKNHELLLDAVAVLVREGWSGRLLVVGSGERESALRRYAEAAGIAARVLWLGWRTDLPELYPAMDCLALTSKDEGTPVALMEAVTAGVPVVARAVGGVPEVLEGGRLGTLVRGDSPEAVAAALLDILDAPPPAEARAVASARMLERFGVERMVAETVTLYREELERLGIPVDDAGTATEPGFPRGGPTEAGP